MYIFVLVVKDMQGLIATVGAYKSFAAAKETAYSIYTVEGEWEEMDWNLDQNEDEIPVEWFNTGYFEGDGDLLPLRDDMFIRIYRTPLIG
jgi:hypothetical protein